MSAASEVAALGRYELLRPIGEGGFSTIYEARDLASGERVALKELTRVSPSSLVRFKQEFRAVQEVHHPNLVRLDALFEDRGKWFIAMELVEGARLLTHLYAEEGSLGFREEQLRDVFTQLADGLLALHDAGFAHLDLKPSNVLVSSEGRVVLLDFGLTTALEPRARGHADAISGTVAYMAPEQAADREFGPAADWYAYGVCMYEALTGLLPIDGDDPPTLLAAKQTETPIRPSLHASGIPSDLDRLCVALLARDPAARPRGAEVRSVVARQVRPARSSGRAASESGRPFEGREQEIQLLREALARAQRGERSVVLVEGDSGIGKSELIKHFLSELAETSPEPWMFGSRCYESELLAFKAFDGVVDGIARCLNELAPSECRALLPPNAALLCRVFPALAQVKQLAETTLSGVAAEPAAQRLEAFNLLARVMGKLAERAPIVITIDDLQWADADSFRLLHALLAAPVSTRMLVLATLRPRSELEVDVLREIDALCGSPGVTELTLTGLPYPEARRLARELMGAKVPEPWLDVVVRESAGHPLFLTVLTRYAESHDRNTAQELTLDAAIAARAVALSAAARRLLETTALIGSPLAAPLCARAAEVSEGERRKIVAELCSQKLLRRRGAGEIACFHDRIRRVVVASLPRAQTRAMHSQIARVLSEQPDTDRAQVARHLEAAGELEQAYRAYRLAAEKALLYLAFARAVALYQRALDVSSELALAPDQRCVLHTALGHALARDGRSARAAREYQAAATRAQGEEQTRLRLWAAQHLLQSADVLAGMQAARKLLSELGVPLASHRATLIAELVWHRARSARRGFEPKMSARPIAPLDRMRLDALAGLSLPLAWSDPLASAALNVRHLRLANALGEPEHVARALAEEAHARSLFSPYAPEIDVLLARARAIATERPEPPLEVFLAFREATVALWRWNVRRTRERSEHALRLCIERCVDQPWLLTNVRTALSTAWAALGEHASLKRACEAWVVEARERNDQFALAMIEGPAFGNFRYLMADDPDRARSALASVIAPWPSEPFSFVHMGELIAVAHIEQYRGGDGLTRYLERELPRLSRALLLKQPFGIGMLRTCRGLADLAAHRGASAGRRRTLQRELQRHANVMKRLQSEMAVVMGLSFEAQLAALRGDTDFALNRSRLVRQRSHVCGFDLERRFDYFEGVLEGGEGGRSKRDGALRFFADQGWEKPRRAIAMLCPALDELEQI